MYLYLIWLNKCRLSSWYSQLQLMLLAIDRKTQRERGGIHEYIDNHQYQIARHNNYVPKQVDKGIGQDIKYVYK